MNKPTALCSSCIDGEIVEDKRIKGLFFCNNCHKVVEIKKFNGRQQR